MSAWEAAGKTDEWYTPKYIFDALGCYFDLDVAAPIARCHVPCRAIIARHSLELNWFGFVWRQASAILFISPKVKFERPDGSIGKSPGCGTVLMSAGARGRAALFRAGSLGFVATPNLGAETTKFDQEAA